MVLTYCICQHSWDIVIFIWYGDNITPQQEQKFGIRRPPDITEELLEKHLDGNRDKLVLIISQKWSEKQWNKQKKMAW